MVLSKKMGGSRPDSQSSRLSVFSEGGLQFIAEESRVPIHKADNSRAQHLAAKAKEWYEQSVMEGLYMATIIYIRESGNWGYGSKLSSLEYIWNECGKVIGERECTSAEIHWESVAV